MTVADPGAVIDVHTHVVVPDVPAVADSAWPSLSREGERAWLELGSGRRRAVPQVAYDMQARLHDMDRLGVRHHVLSPMPAQLADSGLRPDAACAVARTVNDAVVAFRSVDRDRFSAFGTIPASAELDSLMAELGRVTDELDLEGIELSCAGFFQLVRTGGWLTVWEHLGDRGKWLFVHPLDEALAVRRGVEGRLAIAGAGMLNETSLVAIQMLVDGTYSDSSRILLAHGGGTLPYLLGRLDRLWISTDASAEVERPPSEELRAAFHIDSSIHSPSAIAFADAAMGGGRMLFGSDYPFAISIDVADVEAAGVDTDAVLWRSAARAGLGERASAPAQKEEK